MRRKWLLWLAGRQWKRAAELHRQYLFAKDQEHYASHLLGDLEEAIYWAKSKAVELEARANS